MTGLQNRVKRAPGISDGYGRPCISGELKWSALAGSRSHTRPLPFQPPAPPHRLRSHAGEHASPSASLANGTLTQDPAAVARRASACLGTRRRQSTPMADRSTLPGDKEATVTRLPSLRAPDACLRRRPFLSLTPAFAAGRRSSTRTRILAVAVVMDVLSTRNHKQAPIFHDRTTCLKFFVDGSSDSKFKTCHEDCLRQLKGHRKDSATQWGYMPQLKFANAVRPCFHLIRNHNRECHGGVWSSRPDWWFCDVLLLQLPPDIGELFIDSNRQTSILFIGSF
ncbi:hypothetical protein HU200_002248 [Digitaria exilis]|uniref:Uncharacterized protein n=1 Tax=Digitaria exilis TaxID=1010633 RepID=A0A835FXE0_9POAL|nr:hypothetical protein HU200_002248 [Digitaria exilis]